MTSVTVQLCPVSFAELRVGPTEVSVDCPRCATHHDREFLRPRDETLCVCGHRRSAHGRHRGRPYACPMSTCTCNTKENQMETRTEPTIDHYAEAEKLLTEAGELQDQYHVMTDGLDAKVRRLIELAEAHTKLASLDVVREQTAALNAYTAKESDGTKTVHVKTEKVPTFY